MTNQEITEEERERVRKALVEFRIPGSPTRLRFEAATERMRKKFEELEAAIRRSERITAEDLSVTITVTDDF